ncbi:DMT family transporter [uncultured Ferrovibrio sp.]|uniref:DMT family transporter n=1 Tax=uncultured Ferrovibrio sp. TaxID=1576913 RepID=UPI00260BA9C7|nr:DMT family transporter [uncultured Ferrovibrio sp.]
MMVASAFCFCVMHALVAKASQEVPPIEVAFFRNLFGFVALLPAIIRSRFTAFRTTKLHLHALRGALNSTSMMMFFTALAITPLAEATALSYTAPLFMTIGAVFVLHEKLHARRIAALVIGFLGALIVLRPGLMPVGLGPILVIGSTVLWAASMLDIKILARTDSSLTIATYMTVFLMPITFAASLFVWEWPTWEQLGIMFLLGACGSAGHMLFTEAFRYGDTTALMPLDFTKLIWAALIGFFFFGQVPDLWTWVGGTVIFASATYISYREHQISRRAARDAKAAPAAPRN